VYPLIHFNSDTLISHVINVAVCVTEHQHDMQQSVLAFILTVSEVPVAGCYCSRKTVASSDNFRVCLNARQ